jgi:hypothetical protein
MPQPSEALTHVNEHDLDALLRRGSFDLRDVRVELDRMAPDERLRCVRALSGKAQAQLFEAAKGAAKLTLEDMVPASVAPLQEVPHHGKNSLLLFTHFAKVFCRPEAGARELWGYNRNSAFIETVVGPGYYVAYEADGEIMVDYTRLPAGKPEHWPPILSNESRLSRVVYTSPSAAPSATARSPTTGSCSAVQRSATGKRTLAHTGALLEPKNAWARDGLRRVVRLNGQDARRTTHGKA